MFEQKRPLLLLNADAAEGVDPLDTNVNDIDTSYPLLPPSWYVMKITGAEKTPNKKQTGDNLVIKFATTELCQDAKGNEVPPGLTITHRISLVETPDYGINSIKKSVAGVAKAAGLNCTVRDLLNNPPMLAGAQVRAKVKVNAETAEFAASNSIADLKPL